MTASTNKFKQQTAWIWIAVLTFGLLGVMIYSSYIGRSQAERYAPLIDAAMEIRLEVTTSHLWFEEVISGT